MPRALLLISLFALAGCVIPGGVTTGGAPDKISMTEGSWGVMRGGWTIERSGVGRYQVHEGSDGVFAVSAEGFARVQRLLHPIERYIGRDLPCNPGPTDGPYGAIIWTRNGVDAVLPWTTGCVSPERAEIFHAMETASEAVHEIAAAH